MSKVNSTDVETVSDVRKLGTCCYCKRLGKHGDGLICIGTVRHPSGRIKSRELAHPKCYINHFGMLRLLAYVPVDELGTIRMNDVSKRDLKAILHRISLHRSGKVA